MRPVAETAFTNIAKKDLGVRQFVWHPIDAMAAWRIYPLFPLVECGVEKLGSASATGAPWAACAIARCDWSGQGRRCC